MDGTEPMFELLGQIGEKRRDFFPLVEGLLERRNDEKSVRRSREVFRHHDESAVPALL